MVLLCKSIANVCSVWKHCKWFYDKDALIILQYESVINGFTIRIHCSLFYYIKAL